MKQCKTVWVIPTADFASLIFWEFSGTDEPIQQGMSILKRIAYSGFRGRKISRKLLHFSLKIMNYNMFYKKKESVH